MSKKILPVLVTLGFLMSLFGILPTQRVDVAYAKPPDWAPAHGYRRKHGKAHPKHLQKNAADYPYSWTFGRLDSNNDGRISLKEWNEEKELFSILDKNRNGYITPAEYALINAQRGLIGGFLATIKETVGSFLSWLF